jgi:hypothetical protein
MKMQIHVNSRYLLLFAAAVSLLFSIAWPGRAAAMFLAGPSLTTVEKMTIETQWRHRHHQLRRHSRQQADDEHRDKHHDQGIDNGARKREHMPR